MEEEGEPKRKGPLEHSAEEEDDLERKFRQKQAESSPAIQQYYFSEDGKLGKELVKEQVGIMPWSAVREGKERIHIQEASKEAFSEKERSITESVRKVADDFIAEERLAKVILEMEKSNEDKHSAKSKLFNLLQIQSLSPLVIAKSNKSGWEIIFFNSMISLHSLHTSGTKIQAVSSTKEEWLKKMLKEFQGKTLEECILTLQEMKIKSHSYSEWEDLERNDIINTAAMKWLPQALLEQQDAFGPMSMDGWTMYSSPRKRTVTDKQKESKSSRLDDYKSRIADVETLLESNRSGFFDEVCVVDEKNWKKMARFVLERMEEVLSFFPGLGCDVEGQGCTLQLSGLSNLCTVSWLFIGGFIPREIADYLWDRKPWIFQSGADFEKAFGNLFDLEAYDPDLWARDLPTCQERFGIDNLAKLIADADVTWVKKKLKLHFGKDKNYSNMSNHELLYGLTRVGEWFDPKLVNPEMRVYAVLDSVIELKAAVVILGLKLSAVHIKDLPMKTTPAVLLNMFSWSKNMMLNTSQIQVDASNVEKGLDVYPAKNFVNNSLAKSKAVSRTPCPEETRDSAWDRSRKDAAKAIKNKKETFEKQHSGRRREITRRKKNGQIPV